MRAKLQGILEARKDQYANADIHVGLGGADSPLGAPPAVITLRCGARMVLSFCIIVHTVGSAAWPRPQAARHPADLMFDCLSIALRVVHIEDANQRTPEAPRLQGARSHRKQDTGIL